MRIIGGKFKGKTINFLSNTVTRPLKDSVKENIFNVIHHSNIFKIKINNSNVLDIYSGAGSFGIECISRGAKKVKFIEKDLNAFKVLKKNLNGLSVTHNVEIINNKVEDSFNSLNLEKYNIFFFDPPFSSIKFLDILEIFKKKKIHFDNHIVIIHREKKTKENFDNYLKDILIKNYGRSKIIFGKFS